MRLSNRFTGWFAMFAVILLGIVILSRSQRPSERAVRVKPLGAPAVQDTVNVIFPANSELPKYELRMEKKDLASLERSAYSNETVPGTFLANGEEFQNVRVRYRGAWARGWPKKPLKIFFDKEDQLEGQNCINLNSGWRDPAFVREPLAYYVYAQCGVPASRARMVRLDVNGSFRGVYVEVEQPAKSFLKRYDMKGASVYKASSRSNTSDERDLGSERMFASNYEKQTQKTTDSRELQEFCHGLATTTDVAGFFHQNVDIEKYVNYLAATVLVQNWDGFNKNHFIVYDGAKSKKWFAVPWDLDRTLGDHWNWSFNEARLPILLGTQKHPGVTGWNRMQDKFLSQPEFRAQFLNRLEELLETVFTTEKLYPILDKFESQIAAEAREDRRRWPGAPPDVHRGIQELKGFIKDRREYLMKELPRLKK